MTPPALRQADEVGRRPGVPEPGHRLDRRQGRLPGDVGGPLQVEGPQRPHLPNVLEASVGHPAGVEDQARQAAQQQEVLHAGVRDLVGGDLHLDDLRQVPQASEVLVPDRALTPDSQKGPPLLDRVLPEVVVGLLDRHLLYVRGNRHVGEQAVGVLLEEADRLRTFRRVVPVYDGVLPPDRTAGDRDLLFPRHGVQPPSPATPPLPFIDACPSKNSAKDRSSASLPAQSRRSSARWVVSISAGTFSRCCTPLVWPR